jgi:hypothetical protein
VPDTAVLVGACPLSDARRRHPTSERSVKHVGSHVIAPRITNANLQLSLLSKVHTIAVTCPEQQPRPAGHCAPPDPHPPCPPDAAPPHSLHSYTSPRPAGTPRPSPLSDRPFSAHRAYPQQPHGATRCTRYARNAGQNIRCSCSSAIRATRRTMLSSSRTRRSSATSCITLAPAAASCKKLPTSSTNARRVMCGKAALGMQNHSQAAVSMCSFSC